MLAPAFARREADDPPPGGVGHVHVAYCEGEVGADSAIGHGIACLQRTCPQVEGAKLRRSLKAQIDGTGPEHAALRVDDDSRRADVDAGGHEGLRRG